MAAEVDTYLGTSACEYIGRQIWIASNNTTMIKSANAIIIYGILKRVPASAKIAIGSAAGGR